MNKAAAAAVAAASGHVWDVSAAAVEINLLSLCSETNSARKTAICSGETVIRDTTTMTFNGVLSVEIVPRD